MKKLLYGMMAATIMFASSCQNELEVGATGDESVVSFTIATPEMDSRAYSDGLSATVLQYAVYDANGTYLSDLTGTKKFSKNTSVEIKLTTGNNYTVIFWASAPATNESSSPYTVDFANKTMTVNYTNAVSNDESRDAFYATKPIKVTGAMTESIELKRPFAQLNIGTNDFTESNGAGFAPSKSMVSVKSIYNTLNLWNGNVSGEQEVTFDYASIPTSEKFPVENYEYLAMNYLLVGTDKTLIDVEFGFTESDASSAKTRTVGSVPVQRNYRTNIYGQLLTSDVDVNVEINPDYNEPDYSISCVVIVDGVSYNDFATAVAKAAELGKPIEFVKDVTIDADNTIVIPANQSVTLNLNGYTLAGITNDLDKNDDGKITSADNEIMFDIRGTLNVNNGNVSIMNIGDYSDFGWNACSEIFYIGFGGTLNVESATLENIGTAAMAYAIDLVNASNGVTLNTNNSTVKSTYIPVRVFNNGAGMNNVTIKNTTLEGTSRSFWVHIYTQADDATFFNNGKDTNGNGYKDETLNINIYNPACNNTFIADSDDRLIEYGFTDPINFREDGTQISAIVEQKFEVNGIYYEITNAETKEVAVTFKGDNRNDYHNEYSGSVVIPETINYKGTTYSVTSIGDYAFYYCYYMTSISIPKSVTNIGYEAFYHSTGIEQIKVDSENIYFDSRENCNAIIHTETNTLLTGCRNSIIPNSVTSIADLAFFNCSFLTKIIIPNSVTSIGAKAFNNCGYLTSVTIGSSVSNIGEEAFSICTELAEIIVENGNTTYDSRENCNAIIETATGKLISGCKNTIIPNSVTEIGYSAFGGCFGLTSISIPNSVGLIGNQAFSNCVNLKNVTIGNSVYRIDANAFENCSSLTHISIPNSVWSIETMAFRECESLTSVTIGNSVHNIEDSAFRNCTKLTSITIPNSVSRIGEWVFDGCNALTSIVVESDNTHYDSRENCNAIIETATNTLISGCKNSTIPNSVTSIGDTAFANCYGLTNISIHNSVTSIGWKSFYGCSNLMSVSLGNAVNNIDYGAFEGCNSLVRIYSFAAEAPTCYSSVFKNVDTQNCKLYVPQSSVDSYKAASGWKDFKNIIGI